MRSGLFVLAVLTSMVLIFTGCAPKAAPTGKDAPAVAQPEKPAKPPVAEKKEAKKEVAKEAKKEVAPKKAEWMPNVLQNADFSAWTAGNAPDGWLAFDGTQGTALSKSADGKGLSLPVPTGTNSLYVSQKVADTQNHRGKPLRYGGKVKVSKGVEVHIVFSYWADGGEQKDRLAVKATGEWQDVSKEFVLPAKSALGNLKMYIFRKLGAAGEALLGEAFLQFSK